MSTFDLNGSDIGCNDSVVVLLDAITEDLFNVTWDDVLDFDELTTYSNCHNLSELAGAANRSVPFMDNATYCLNESDIYDVVVNVGEFVTVLVDVLTLSDDASLNVSALTVGTIVELLDDPLVADIVEEAFNVTVDDQWIDDLYTIDYIDEDLTVGQIVADFQELDLLLQILRVIEGLSNGRLNATAINNVIDLLLGENNNVTFTTLQPQV